MVVHGTYFLLISNIPFTCVCVCVHLCVCVYIYMCVCVCKTLVLHLVPYKNVLKI